MKITRRAFAEKILRYLPLAALATFFAPTLRFVLFPFDKKDKKVTIQKNRLVSEITKIEDPPMFIIAENETPVKVLNSHCTHMGCVVNFDANAKRFVCPCHGSQYNIDGTNIRGPAKKPLHSESFKVEKDKIVVDYRFYYL